MSMQDDTADVYTKHTTGEQHTMTNSAFPNHINVATPSSVVDGLVNSDSTVSRSLPDDINDIVDPDERAEQILEDESDGEDIRNNPLAKEEKRAAKDLDSRRQNQLRKQAKFTKASVIIPPENFAIVEDGLYRSAQPTELNFPFLERLHLHSLIWLAPEEPIPIVQQFIREHGIKLYHLGVQYTWNAWDPSTEDAVMKALEIILQPTAYPLMVMCNLGRHRTGTVIGCLRKLQRWNLASIFEEYRRHAGAKVRVMNEQFIELFDTDLVTIPNPNAPANGVASTESKQCSPISHG